MAILFRVLLFTVAVIGTFAEISFEDLKFQIYTLDNGGFEDAVNRRINEAIDSASKLAQGAKAMSLVPYLDQVMKPASSVMDAIKNNIWKEALVAAISDESHRNTMKQAFTDMKSKMITVSQDLVTLRNLGDSLDDKDKSSKAQNMYDKLSDINNMFIQRDSFYRQYPRFAYLPLAAFTPVVALLHPVYSKLSPTLAQHSFLSCRLLDNLREYQFLLVASRLKDLDILAKSGIGGKGREPYFKDKFVGNVLRREYNRYGYNGTAAGTIDCEEIGCDFATLSGLQPGELCLIDRQARKHIYVGSRKTQPEEARNCIVGYAEFLRSSIEKAYQPHIDITSAICDEMRDRRKPTGLGWWTLVIIGMEARTKRNSADACDPYPLFPRTAFSECDPYALLFINGDEVLRTEKSSDRNENYVMHKYESAKMPKDSDVRFEIWDSDVGDNNLCLVLEKNIKDLENIPYGFQEGQNFIAITSIWRDYYEDDGDL